VTPDNPSGRGAATLDILLCADQKVWVGESAVKYPVTKLLICLRIASNLHDLKNSKLKKLLALNSFRAVLDAPYMPECEARDLYGPAKRVFLNLFGYLAAKTLLIGLPIDHPI